MKILDRYILLSLAKTLLFTLLVLALLYVVIDLVDHRRGDILEHRVPARVVAVYYVYYLPYMLLWVTPVAYLISVLFTVGNLARNNELVAARAGGVDIRRVVMGPLAVGMVLSGLVFLLNERVLPRAMKRANDIEEVYFSGRKGFDKGKEITLTDPSDELRTIFINKYYPDSKRGTNVTVLKLRPDLSPEEKITAQSIEWNKADKQWKMIGVSRSIYTPGSARKEEKFETFVAPFSCTPEELLVGEASPEELPSWRLRQLLMKWKQGGYDVRDFWVQYHMKFAVPAASFIIAMLGIPFATSLRRGGLVLSFGIATAVALTYYLLLQMGGFLGKVGTLPPVLAAWGVNLVFLAVGVGLMSRMQR